MGVTGMGGDSEVVKWVKHSILRWFGNMMKINEDESVNGT